MHRLVSALEDHGFLFHVGGMGYALGPRLLALASTAMRELPLRQLARPVLEDLARTTGESAQLYVRQGDRRICVDAVESDNELRTIVPIGASLPLGKGSAGKVFLAWGRAPADLDISDIGTSLLTTRRRGWADSYGERQKGVASVSAPDLRPGRSPARARSPCRDRRCVWPDRAASATGRRWLRPRGEVEALLGR